MRINSITKTTQVANKQQHLKHNSIYHSFIYNDNSPLKRTTNVTFQASSAEIEQLLARKGITCDFAGNSFVAECVNRTVNLFENLFGKSSLPSEVNYRYIGSPDVEGIAQYWATYNRVDINSADSCFNNKSSLQNAMIKHKRVIGMPAWLSTSHYLHPIVHEFGHGAHFNNIESRGNDYTWSWMTDKIPNAVGKLITKFKLSSYANYNLKEFMAERISKDVCKNLNYNDCYIGDKKDIDYSNIFSRKWNCRYSTPQAYLDYYTQQINMEWRYERC